MLGLELKADAQQVIVPLSAANIPEMAYTSPTYSPDILGINIGMTDGSVETALTNSGFKRDIVDSTKFSANKNINGVSRGIVSDQFKYYELWRKSEKGISDEVEVHYNSPLSGKHVYFVKRALKYDSNAPKPTVDEFSKTVFGKYGPANANTSHDEYICWTWAGHRRNDIKWCYIESQLLNRNVNKNVDVQIKSRVTISQGYLYWAEFVMYGVDECISDNSKWGIISNKKFDELERSEGSGPKAPNL